ncbi:MAG: hypothetical protein DLM70_01125 [Chloroflexi bacterium]|nr:MAG: hypothetical protein DLM70_01125 [Chloroflexota bacterium]
MIIRRYRVAHDSPYGNFARSAERKELTMAPYNLSPTSSPAAVTMTTAVTSGFTARVKIPQSMRSFPAASAHVRTETGLNE